MHQRRLALVILSIWIGTIFQEELDEAEVGSNSRAARSVRGSKYGWMRRSVDVGAVSDQLMCQGELIHLSQGVIRIHQLSQPMKSSGSNFSWTQWRVLWPRPDAGIHELKQKQARDCWPAEASWGQRE